MKIRGSVVGVVTSAAVILLVCSLVLIEGFRNSRSIFHQYNSSKSRQSPSGAASAARASNPKSLEAYGKLPLGFAENVGQTAQEVRYVSHGSQYDLFLTPQEAVLALTHAKRLDFSPRRRNASLKAMREARKAAITTTAIRMQFEGSNPNAQIAGAEPLPGRANYYIGNDSKKWHTGIPTYAQVKYSQVYPGVDLVFYGNQRRLEYDFVVAPGVDPRVIRMRLEGAKKLRLDAQGDVLLTVADGEVRLQKPIIYQNINGQRQKIAGKYSLRGEYVSLAVAQYDRREPLIVDPVLNYSTYLGGSGEEQGLSIVLDTAGDAYVAGVTTSIDFPPPHALSGIVGNTAGVAFVTEVNPSGTALVNSTYLGGTAGGDVAFGVALDSTGNIYVTGSTAATDFPTTTNALKQSPLSANASGASFLTKLSPTFTLLYSSYLGGTGGDHGDAIAVDSTGNAYVTGFTDSAPGTGSGTGPDNLLFPVLNGYQTTLPDTFGSAFLTRIDTTKLNSASLIYSTYLGGNGANFVTAGFFFGDDGFGIVVDAAHKAYIAGTTTSTDFVPNPPPAGTLSYQSAPVLANLWGTAFVSVIDTTITSGAPSLVYSTYLGGAGDGGALLGDFGDAIDLRSGTSVVYVTGGTSSSNTTFPLLDEYSNVADPAGVGFVTLLDTSITGVPSLKYSTFYSSANTFPNGIKADAAGNAYVVGGTASPNLPLTPGAFQPTLASGAGGDGFVAELNTTGAACAATFPCASELLYSTYFGGTGVGSPDVVFALALGGTTPPTVYITGETFATNLPVFPAATAATPAFQTALDGTSDAFVAELTLVPTLVVSPNTLTFTATQQGVATLSQNITLTNNTSAAIAFTSATITSPTPAAAATDFAVTNTSCGTSILAGTSCTLGVVFTASSTAESATVSITDGDSSSPQTVALTGTAPALFNIAPTTLTFNSTAVGTPTAAQVVTITNNTGVAVPFTSDVVTLTSATGAAADFAAISNCGASVPTTGCTISVVYTPSVAAMETATLTLTDGAGVQTVALTGTVTAVPPDFTVSAPATLTVTKGKSGTATVTVGSVGGFASAVALACTGQPNKSTCSIAPSPISPAAAGPATATLTLTTTSLVAPPPTSPRFPPVSIRVVVPVFAALLMLLLCRSEQRFRTRIGLAGALLVFVALAGCSSSSGTPKGTSTLTITGTSGALTHTATITLTVD